MKKNILNLIWLRTFAGGILLSLGSISFAENRALLVGINNYPHVSPDLIGSLTDVDNIYKLALNNMGFKQEQITRLKADKATKRNIISRIKNELIDKTSAGDRVLFYYSGHGYQIKDRNGDEIDSLDETLVPVDTGKDGNIESNMITDDELGSLFDQITDRKVTIIIDSCHSGTITRGLVKKKDQLLAKTIQGKKSIYRGLDDITESHEYKKHREEVSFLKQKKNRVVWSAVSAGQLAFVDDTITPRQGVFTRWFYDGIVNKTADYNHDGIISLAELFLYTSNKSTEFCKKHKKCNLGLSPSLEAPSDLLGLSSVPHSGFTNPHAVDVLANNLLPAIDESSILIDVEVNQKKTNRLRLGEELSILVQSKKRGFLLLLDRDATGKLKQLYPNKTAKNNKIEANEEVFIPLDSSQYTIKATELGDSQLIAIVTHDKIDLSNIIIKPSKDIMLVAKPRNYLSNLAARLQTTWTGDKVNRRADYAITKYDYRVTR